MWKNKKNIYILVKIMNEVADDIEFLIEYFQFQTKYLV